MIFQTNYLLLAIILLPLIGISILLVIPSSNQRLCFSIAFLFSCIIFLISLVLWVFFDNSSSHFQYLFKFNWFFNIYYTVGIDGISLFFILLSTLLIPICLLISVGSVHKFNKEYLICFLFLESLLIQVFSVLDLVFFYVFFESVLIPMFLIVGIWGSRERKIRAAYQFFLYTLVGSLLFLIALIFIYFQTGTSDLQILRYHNFSENQQLVLWLAFFASFAVKIPMIPFHIWLPEAHAEAPTAGSVILAGILLKMGGYGFIRFSLPLFVEASIFFTPLIYTLSIVATIYASLITLRQVDFKKAIAYSSVAHMSFVTLGIFSYNLQALEGSIILMLAHGIVASALFLCIGMLYDRSKTRIIKYYSGLTQTMPIHSIFFMFFIFSSIAFPGTCNFVGEFLVLLGLFETSSFVSIISSLGMILGAGYSIWLYNRMYFGSWKEQYISKFQDISRRELWIFIPLIISVLWMGLQPTIFLDTLHGSTSYLFGIF
uniref:NADH dehydrogenase subunit 4 n=1 Tax=Sahlingia subintegra TaxID=468936 RepID=UPI001FCDD2C0|nr:NADH dehydrogenase subunit 4 [Sahlingia subintegra]UNJ19076.1 NADH dehydrogenase subunit 4 [Sahlingia subintegra]